jgi:hypothetical protein
MKAKIVDQDALGAISPQSLRAYAESEGWTSNEVFGNHSRVFSKANIGLEAIIPATKDLGDYTSVVAQLIEIFSKSENRDELQIYRDLATADRDTVRVRSPDAEDDGSIRIEAGVDLVVYARDLLLSAACSAWEPKSSYRAGRVAKADDYMSRVRLGQTEQGSFVVTLLAPVPPTIKLQQSMFKVEENEPYERMVTHRLSTGLDGAANAIEQFNLGGDFSSFENEVQQGVSANLCEAIANLSEEESGIEISISWARTRPVTVPRWSRIFTRPEGEILKEAARMFYDSRPRLDERLIGYIHDLHSEDTSQKGRVKLKTFVDEKPVSIKMELNAADYAKAIGAHRDGKAISVLGSLVRDGRRWKLNNPTDLSLMYEELDEDQI